MDCETTTLMTTNNERNPKTVLHDDEDELLYCFHPVDEPEETLTRVFDRSSFVVQPQGFAQATRMRDISTASTIVSDIDSDRSECFEESVSSDWFDQAHYDAEDATDKAERVRKNPFDGEENSSEHKRPRSECEKDEDKQLIESQRHARNQLWRQSIKRSLFTSTKNQIEST